MATTFINEDQVLVYPLIEKLSINFSEDIEEDDEQIDKNSLIKKDRESTKFDDELNEKLLVEA